jgi:hypothetical protein
MSVRAAQIATLINEVYDGVERSRLGPIEFENEDGSKGLNNLAYHSFLTILSSVTPKNFSGVMDVKED